MTTEQTDAGPGTGTAARPRGHLADNHRALLAASGIPQDVADERSYFTVTTKAALDRLGFGRTQLRAPGLVIPLWNVIGDCVGYQLRPDDPRVDDHGRPIKYETPRKQPNVVDVPPRVLPLLDDPEVPLVVTEWSRKADSAASRGLCCVSVNGVYGWRGTNAKGGKAALTDWELIPLNRTVLLAFDSDAMTKPEVHQALARMRAFLRLRKATVLVVYLPSAASGGKVGLDDWLAETPERGYPELAALAREDLDELVEPEPVESYDDVPDESGAALLDDLAAFYRRFVGFPSTEAGHAVALWAAHTHLLTHFDYTPRLYLRSPEKQSGKSMTLELLERTVARPEPTSNMSPAVLYRLAGTEPTFLFDEIDSIFSPHSDREELRGVINAGFRRGGMVQRFNREANEVERFPVYAPLVMAGNGTLPDTIVDRSVVIPMRRATRVEVRELGLVKLRWRHVNGEAEALQRRLAAWAHRQDELPIIEAPDELGHRAADVWEVLLSVAAVAGGHWPKRAWQAALVVGAGQVEDAASSGTTLLVAIREVLDEREADALSSSALKDALNERDDVGWLRSQKDLAVQLAPYGIRPRLMRGADAGGRVLRGYFRSDFDEAWARYVTASPPSHPGFQPLQPLQARSATCAVTDVADKSQEREPECGDTSDAAPSLADLANASHVIGVCDTCGEETLIARGNSPRCRITPECKGHHRPQENQP